MQRDRLRYLIYRNLFSQSLFFNICSLYLVYDVLIWIKIWILIRILISDLQLEQVKSHAEAKLYSYHYETVNWTYL